MESSGTGSDRAHAAFERQISIANRIFLSAVLIGSLAPFMAVTVYAVAVAFGASPYLSHIVASAMLLAGTTLLRFACAQCQRHTEAANHILEKATDVWLVRSLGSKLEHWWARSGLERRLATTNGRDRNAA